MEKVCLCKKDIFIFNRNLFKKDKYYKYRVESNPNDIWVVYNELGDYSNSGYRFYLKPIQYSELLGSSDSSNCLFFKDYFYSERATKLLKIKSL